MKTQAASQNGYFASKFSVFIIFCLLSLCSVSQCANPFALGKVAEPQDIALSEIPQDDLIKLAKSAESNPDYCYELGSRYYNGRQVTQDYKTASIWFNKGAELGDPACLTTLGYLYFQGKGVSVDHKIAFDCFHKAAKKEFPRAQYNMGLMYYRGIGVDKNIKQAVLWLSRAAKNNDGQAQYVLGCLYLVGEGVNEDNISAYKWLLLAEYNDIDVEALKSVVEQSMSPFERKEAISLAGDFIDSLKESGKIDKSVSSEILPDGPVRGGTGFFISKDGYILTSYHIIRDSDKIKIKSELGIIPADLVMYDTTVDFALLKINGFVNCKPLPLADSDHKISLNEPVWSFGYKTALKTTASPDFVSGVVTSLAGDKQIIHGKQKEVILKQKTEEENIVSKSAPNVRFFKLECSAGPGNAGGAVVGENGMVSGIFASEMEQGPNADTQKWPIQEHYAVKISFVLPFLEVEPELINKIKIIRSGTMLDKTAVQAKSATVQVLVY